ncbi:MAG TPA: STAS domain-containing protein [Pyrinomonadaceae bacterium]|jgi:anti-sigma B factor antagonist|nr:STAS domain-containing protein [Pyrinomonadaceae bacterium]
MSELNISTRDVKGITVIDIEGRIALGDSSAKLHQSLRDLVDGGKHQILINLAKVTGIDSSGLGTLVAGYTTVERAGGQLKLENLSERALELMTITKLFTVFEIFDNEDAAINSFGQIGAASGNA